MQLLAIDTASPMCSAALYVQGVTYERSRYVPQGHGHWILPMVEGLLDEANTSLERLSGIAFGRGPGTFTGVRMATAVAQGIAFGAKLDVIPVSNLKMLAYRTWKQYAASKVVVGIDARMGEVYWGCFEVVADKLVEVSPECLCKPDEPPELPGGAWVAAGTGFGEYPSLSAYYGEQLVEIDGEQLPRAVDALPIAIDMFEDGNMVSPELAAPVYLRDKVAWK